MRAPLLDGVNLTLEDFDPLAQILDDAHGAFSPREV
jgi:hypothetical protein